MNLLYTVLNLEITTEHTPGVSAIKSSCKKVIEVYICCILFGIAILPNFPGK